MTESRRVDLSKKGFATSHTAVEGDTNPCKTVVKGEEHCRLGAERELLIEIDVVHGLALIEHSCPKDLLNAH